LKSTPTSQQRRPFLRIEDYALKVSITVRISRAYFEFDPEKQFKKSFTKIYLHSHRSYGAINPY